MKWFFVYFVLLLALFCCSQQFAIAQEVKATVVNDADDTPMEGVHVINLTNIKSVITNQNGEFEISAKAQDTLYFSFIGFKAIKVRVTSDLIKFEGTKIRLTEFAYALEEVVLQPYQLTGFLYIDSRNAPINTSYRYRISGLSRGYEAGSYSPGAVSRVISSIFNPADFLHNLFGKKPKQLRKLRKMKADDEIRNLLASKFDRETLRELLQVERVDIDETLRNCNYSDGFIRTANDLQILDAISDCYEEFRLLNR